MSEKKYWWYKMNFDFFRHHEVIILESEKSGEKHLLFYIKLLCEAVKHHGNLRYSETKPYTPKMLAAVTHTNPKIAENALKILQELEILEHLPDGTYHFTDFERFIGSETGTAERVRNCRERRKNEVLQCNDSVTQAKQECNATVTQELRDKSKEIDIKESPNRYPRGGGGAHAHTLARVREPSLEEVKAYQKELGSDISAERFYDYYSARGWEIDGRQVQNWKALYRSWKTFQEQKGNAAAGKEKRVIIGKDLERPVYSADQLAALFTPLEEDVEEQIA